MLRYLTHKLQKQTLNENQQFQSKANDDHDSGTESDDESADIEEIQKYMESEILLGSSRSQECQEEEDSRLSPASKTNSPFPALDSALPSDSDHNFDHHSSEEELEVINCAAVRSTQFAEKRKWSQANRLSLGDNSASSDDEIRDLMCISTPVKFRTSPPANLHKPSRSLSPPPKVFHSADLPPHELCSVSPRKRHRRTPSAIQRPCLDFEKMQQIRVRLL